MEGLYIPNARESYPPKTKKVWSWRRTLLSNLYYISIFFCWMLPVLQFPVSFSTHRHSHVASGLIGFFFSEIPAPHAAQNTAFLDAPLSCVMWGCDDWSPVTAEAMPQKSLRGDIQQAHLHTTCLIVSYSILWLGTIHIYSLEMFGSPFLSHPKKFAWCLDSKETNTKRPTL